MSGLSRGCFHCGEPLPEHGAVSARVQGSDRSFCCAGCRAAAELIGTLGLEDFYRFRTAPPLKPVESSDQWLLYDDAPLMQSLTEAEPRGRAVVLLIGGVTCAACGWLITRSLQCSEGVRHVSVNTATGRARLVWDPAAVKLSQLLRLIEQLGYRPQIVGAGNGDSRAKDERRALLKRLAVAGLGMMQVMMFAVAMYAGDRQGMDADVRTYLRGVSMLVATPVMLYGGWPYFVGAAQALSRRCITMDIPVTLGLMLAYGTSVYDTARHAGEVYFDSVTMFIFFLTVARYVEMTARHRSTQLSDSLSRTLPAIAHRISAGDAADPSGSAGSGDTVRDVVLSHLMIGDRLLVRAGEVAPADGDLTLGSTQFDESMLTGESLPVERTVGDRITAGTINLGAPVQMRVAALGRDTVLAGIVSLLNRAQSERPRIARACDRAAGRFLLRVLIGAVLVCVFWHVVDPARAFDATLAVLVVACPCAFSLATQVAVASATAALARRGILVTNPDAIENLTHVTRVVFDKTGTLTRGVVSLSRCTPLGALPAAECLRIAAALEVGSEHPIARAFSAVAPQRLHATDLRTVAGGGVAGFVDGQAFRIGTRDFAAQRSGSDRGGGSDSDSDSESFEHARIDDAAIFLSSDAGELAAFTLADEPRPESSRAVAALHSQGLATEILSGDSLPAVQRLAQHCGIARYAARQAPNDKTERIRALNAQGEFVAMVGDGINDAPVLGGSGVAVAMSRASALTLAGADLILVGDTLLALPDAFHLARRTALVIRQNLRWSAAYNLAAMPLAALGWVPPWAAAIGMSMSSIFVVLNSLRLIRERPPRASAQVDHAPAGRSAQSRLGFRGGLS